MPSPKELALLLSSYLMIVGARSRRVCAPAALCYTIMHPDFAAPVHA